MAREDPHFRLRLPTELKQRIEEAAQSANRSINAEIVFRLDGWEDAIEQIDLAQQGWEIERERIQAKDELIQALQVELGEAISRQEGLEDRLAEHRLAFSEAKRSERSLRAEIERLRGRIAVPAGLLKRIDAKAKLNGRPVEEEVANALEGVYPPTPLHLISPFLDIGMVVLQWHKHDWHIVDWETFSRFRGGDNTTIITQHRDTDVSHLLVAVFNSEDRLMNLIPHAYVIDENGYSSATEGLLTQEELSDYRRLMVEMHPTDEDKNYLETLQEKMWPALALPIESIPHLRSKLAEIAYDSAIDDVLRSRRLTP